MENTQKNTQKALSDLKISSEKPTFLEKIAIFVFLAYIFSIFVFSTYAETNMISKGIFVIFCGVCFPIFFKNRKLKLDPYFGFFSAFALYIYINSLWAINAALTFEKGFTIVQIIVLCVLSYSLFYSIENYSLIDKSIYISGIAMCFYLIAINGLSNFLQMMSEGERMGGEIANVNSVGMYAVMSLFIGLYYAMFKKHYLNYLFIAFLVFIALSTGSKKVIISIVLCGLFFFFIKFRSKLSAKNIITSIIVAAVLIFAFSCVLKLEIFKTINHRMESIFNLFSGHGKVDNSTNVRKEMIEYGLEQFRKMPFTGIGIGNADYKGYAYLHNNYIEMLAGGGLFGFILCYLPYAYLIFNLSRLVFKYKNQNAVPALIMIFLRLLFDTGAVSYYGKTTYIYLTYCFLVVKKEKNLNERIIENENS